MKRISTLLVSLFLLACVSSIQASTLTPGLYQLLDHPDSALTNLPVVSYGLRLDQLGGTAAERTFSATQDGAFVTLDWDGSTAIISGSFSNNATNELWTILYTLTPTVMTAEGFEVTNASGSGTGTLSNGMTVINLAGKSSSAGVIFSALADGYRCSGEPCIDGEDTAVARGWLTVDGYASGSNDFLVQLTPVPLPAALPLLLSGVLGFSVFSRKKQLG
jgi:hypothetical protein